MPWAGFPGMVLVSYILVLWLSCLQAQPGLAAQLLSIQIPWPEHARSFHLFLWPSTLLHPKTDHPPYVILMFGRWGGLNTAGRWRQDIIPPAPSLPGPPQAGHLWRSQRWVRWYSSSVSNTVDQLWSCHGPLLPRAPLLTPQTAAHSALSSLSSDAAGCSVNFTL